MCGNGNLPPPPSPTNRIVGGWPTTEHQFPWMAAVLRRCEDQFCQICGATIISGKQSNKTSTLLKPLPW